MGELYERLKERIDESDSLSPFHGAVRAVLELHKPYKSWPSGALVCDACLDRGGPYPCSTVRAIARALDVPISEGDHREP